jgi:hypothetical protein
MKTHFYLCPMVDFVLSQKIDLKVVFGAKTVKKGFRISPLHQNVHSVVLHDTIVPVHHIDKYLPNFDLI